MVGEGFESLRGEAYITLNPPLCTSVAIVPVLQSDFGFKSHMRCNLQGCNLQLELLYLAKLPSIR